MKKIEALKQVQALIGETYMYAVIVAIVALAVAFGIANLVKYQGGKNSNDHITRRIWFIVIGVVTAVAFFLYNALYVSSYITKAPLQAQFTNANIIATLVVVVVYAGVGVLTMFVIRHSKWGSILGSAKK
jgi:cytochrome bd-type quinol oxidase subunit 2